MATSSVLRIVNFLGILHLVVGVHIEINPNRYTDQTANNQAVQITCKPGNVLQCADKDVLMLKLRKVGQESLAFVNIHHGRSKVTAASDTLYQTRGHIGKRCHKSYLQVTLPNPRNDDSGRYQCSMFYHNNEGTYVEEKASETLTVELFQVNPVVKSLLKRVSELESNQEDQALKISDQVVTLISRIQSLEETDGTMVGITRNLRNETLIQNERMSRLEEIVTNQVVTLISRIQQNLEKTEGTMVDITRNLTNETLIQNERISRLEEIVSENVAALTSRIQNLEELNRTRTELSQKLRNETLIHNESLSLFKTVSLKGKQFLYFIPSFKMNYYDARDHCRSLGAYLIHFDYADEINALKSFLTNQEVHTEDRLHVWVGANDINSEGTWVNQKYGTKLDTNKWIWCKKEPNNSENEDCASYRLIDGLDDCLNDYKCDIKMPFVCEKKPTKP